MPNKFQAMCKDLYKLDKMTNFAAVIYETL